MALVLGRSVAAELDGTWCDRERRGSPRSARRGSVRVFEARSGVYFAGNMVDVSETGLRVRMPAFGTADLREGLQVHVVMLADGERGALRLGVRRAMAGARVVWTAKAAVAGELEMGLEFLSGERAAVDAA